MKNNTSKKTIPNRLRRHRKVRGLKQKQVASILGLKSTSMISRWESGCCLPNTLNVFRLSILYRSLADALFFDFIRELREDLIQKEETVLNGGNKS